MVAQFVTKTLNNMTTQERLNLRIKDLSIECFGYESDHSLLALKVDLQKTKTFSLALLKLLLFLSQNVFKDGKLHLPVWKWPSVIVAIKEFLNSI